MKNRIKNLKIENFKSIREAELECGRINLFIGKPNIGKSNVLEAMSLLCGVYSGREKFLSQFIRYEKFSHLFHFQDTSSPLIVKSNLGGIYFKHNYRFDSFDYFQGSKESIDFLINNEMASDEFRNKFHSGLFDLPIPIGTGIIGTNGELSDRRGQDYSPVKKYQFQPNSKINYREKSYLLPPHGKNLFWVMESNRRLREEVPELFDEYDLKFLTDEERNSFDLIREEGRIYKRIPYSLIADTLQRIIFHYAAIFSNKDSVILFEEPESHSFPPYVRELALKVVEDIDNQYFITMHSPHLFNTIVEETETKDLAVFLTYFENYETKFKKLSKDDLSELLNYGIDIFFNSKYFMDEPLSENPA